MPRGTVLSGYLTTQAFRAAPRKALGWVSLDDGRTCSIGAPVPDLDAHASSIPGIKFDIEFNNG